MRVADLNVLRWRYGRNALGEETVESNARFVRWSDGSLQLQIGTEVLDVASQDVAREQSHLFVRHPGAGLIQAQAHLRTKLVFRPSSLQSKSHRMLRASIDQRHAKVTKIKKVVTTVDPEAEKAAREKEELRLSKDRELLARKQAGVDRRYGVEGRRGGGLLDREFLEGDDGAPPSRVLTSWRACVAYPSAFGCLRAAACCSPGAHPGDGEDAEAMPEWTGTADARALLSRGGASGGTAAAAAAAAERAKAKRKRPGRTVLVDSDEDSAEDSWSEEDDRPKRGKARKRVAGMDDDDSE